MVTVLVTGAGGVGGLATVRTLQNHTDHEVVAVDMDPTAAALCTAERMRTVPPATADAWTSEMASVVSEFGVDAIVPTVDEELIRLPALREAVSDDVSFVVPRPEIIDKTTDKYAFAKLLEGNGLSVPDTYLATEAPDIPESAFPAIAKPRRGRGSDGVERLEDRDQLSRYVASTDRDSDDVVVQRYVGGVEYTTSIVATRDNDLLSIVPKRVIEKRGNTYRGVTKLEPEIVQSCRELFDALRPCGPMNAQQILNEETGEAYTFEINPRFSSTACLTVAAGVNELDLLVRDACGESVSESQEFVEGVHLVRYTDELFVREEELTSVRPEAD